MSSSTSVQIKRVYEPSASGDGYRILVDRLWPRGMKKENAGVDKWLKEVAPSTELRKWFHHEEGNWAGFEKAYLKELQGSAALEELAEDVKKHKKVTLLYGAKDEAHNHALVLQRVLKAHGV